MYGHERPRRCSDNAEPARRLQLWEQNLYVCRKTHAAVWAAVTSMDVNVRYSLPKPGKDRVLRNSEVSHEFGLDGRILDQFQTGMTGGVEDLKIHGDALNACGQNCYSPSQRRYITNLPVLRRCDEECQEKDMECD